MTTSSRHRRGRRQGVLLAAVSRLLKDAGYATALVGKWYLGNRTDSA